MIIPIFVMVVVFCCLVSLVESTYPLTAAWHFNLSVLVQRPLVRQAEGDCPARK
jgi:hypothetical protein